MPPTPPSSDTEFEPYTDSFAGFLYEPEPMDESELPPVFSEKGIILKSPKPDPVISSSVVVSNATTPVVVEVPQAVAGTKEVRQRSTAPSDNRCYSETIANIRNSVSQKSAVKEMQPRNLFSATLTSTKVKQTPRRNTTPPPGGLENEAAEVLQDWNVVEDFSLLNVL